MVRPKKDQLRLRVGWKHQSLKNALYTQISERAGGGVHMIQVDRTCTLDHLQEKLGTLFFPDGMSAQGTFLSDYNHFIAEFNGKKMPLKIDGEDFTFGKFRDTCMCSPARLYFHTYPVSYSMVINLKSC
jgi:hypothetical protein